jgi:methylamine dehydrogenase accessory protein MauD
MNILLLVSAILLWLAVGFLAFLLLGTLRSLGVLSWRLEQLEATTPKRLGREGLKPGKKAPDFTLPSAEGNEVSLHGLAGRRVLLVFTQSGCSPCKTVVPELNRLERDDTHVLVVNNGDPEATRKWSAEVGARFPVLTQEKFSISKKYEVFATPFAFLIDEKGIIASKGIINNRQHISYVLSGKRFAEPGAESSEPGAFATGESNGQAEAEPAAESNGEANKSASTSISKEVRSRPGAQTARHGWSRACLATALIGSHFQIRAHHLAL